MEDTAKYDRMNAIDKLISFRNQYFNCGCSTECEIIAKAINEVLPKLDKMSHLKAAEYTLSYSETLKDKRVAVFDDRLVSEEEILRHIRAGEYHDQILDMSEKQYQNIFQKAEADAEESITG